MINQNIASCLSIKEENREVILSPLEYTHILDLQNHILDMMTVGHNEKETLAQLCEMTEKLLPNSVASIMIKDPSTGLLNVISAPTIPQAGHEALSGLKPGLGGGSCGNAVFSNAPQYVLDTKTDSRWSNIRQIAFDFNLCSCWSMPIRNQYKEAIGSFALSSFEHRSPSEFHKRLLEIGAFIINIILTRSKNETQLDQSNKKLEIFAVAAKNSSDGMTITDANNNIIEVNEAFLTITGYKREEVLGKNPSILSSGRHDKSFFQEMWSALLLKKHWSGEIYNKRASGEIFPEWISISAITDEKGHSKNYLAIFADLSELHNAQEKLTALAYNDNLTGLPNRHKITDDMDALKPQACVIFDINDFKEINDFFGVSAGDNILKQISAWFIEMGVYPYRINGDEFALLFYEKLSYDTLYKRVSELLFLAHEKLFFIEKETISLQMTAGVSIGGIKLLTHADIALHQAKIHKRTIGFYEEQANIEETYRANIIMAAKIRHAISNQRIICYYQPIVNLKTGAIDKFETLVRIIDEDGSIILPMEFLSIAKKTKLYPKITQEVVRQACNLFASRSEEFSINLSDSDIRDPNTVAHIIKTLIQTGTASRIVFEILESEGIENYEEVAIFIAKVKELGAKIAIDDFGTGYSNFENVLMLGVDYIKIDGSLVSGITFNSRHHIIVETIMDFSRKIGAKTIAEFVSDSSIYQAVKELGIDYSQGYYTGKPELL